MSSLQSCTITTFKRWLPTTLAWEVMQSPRSVRFHSIFITDCWPRTFAHVYHGHSSQEIECHKSGSRVKLMQTVRPQSRAFFSSCVLWKVSSNVWWPRYPVTVPVPCGPWDCTSRRNPFPHCTSFKMTSTGFSFCMCCSVFWFIIVCLLLLCHV